MFEPRRLHLFIVAKNRSPHTVVRRHIAVLSLAHYHRTVVMLRTRFSRLRRCSRASAVFRTSTPPPCAFRSYPTVFKVQPKLPIKLLPGATTITVAYPNTDEAQKSISFILFRSRTRHKVSQTGPSTSTQ